MTIEDLKKAIESKDPSEVDRVLATGVDINSRDDEGWTPLSGACSFANIAIVDMLIRRGAQVNKPDQDGETPLHHAAYRGDPKMVRLLIDHGADIDARNNDGNVPVNWGLTNRSSDDYIEALKILLSTGADVHVRGPNGGTPLHQAARNNNIRGAALLLQYGAEINAVDQSARKPLQLHLDQDRGADGDQMEDLLESAGGEGWG